MRERGLSRAWLLGVIGAHLLAPTSAARARGDAIAWDAPCGDPSAFAARVEELGGELEGVEVEVGVSAVEEGFHGRLRVVRGDERAAREIDDAGCEDVLDALAIAAALALRALGAPAAPVALERAPAASEIPEALAPQGLAARLGVGAALRGGLGPVPDAALAPAVVVALELGPLWAGLSVSYWPEAAATLDERGRGVTLFALGTTLEVGYRIGGEVAVVPCAVVESSVAFARGTGVERPRSEATWVLDAGAAVWLTLDLEDRVRLFARAELLVGLARPIYGVEAEAVFASPLLRGAGGGGVLVMF
ncbi:MAG: hypothetical protein KF729_03465 [Sandaracinaceae bacterium]|nr:hypothetical protein [Sandaracinaceae bacterium]